MDDEDVQLAKLSWQLNSTGYVRRTIRLRGSGKHRTLLMHRFIMGEPEGKVVDHINGDKLDNRRCNLRIGTQSDNLRNRKSTKHTSKYLGVSRHVERRWKTNKVSWVAQITIDGKHHRKMFNTELEAAQYRDKYIREQGDNFAPLNFEKTDRVNEIH